MHALTRIATALALTAASLASASLLAEEARYNQIALRAEVSQEIAHDLMHVTLYSEAQDDDPAAWGADLIASGTEELIQQIFEATGLATGSTTGEPDADIHA